MAFDDPTPGDLQPLSDEFLRRLPRLNTAPAPARRGLVSAGLASGLDQLQALGGRAIQAVGRAADIKAVDEFGRGIAERNEAEAKASGRPDLEIAPWKQGGASVAPWLAYQVLKQGPQIGASIALGRLIPGAAVSSTLARAGASIPSVLGGGGLRAGATIAQRRAAVAAGQSFARTATGGAIVGAPLGVGSMFQEADSKPGGATRADAFRALAMGVPYGMMDALQPTQFAGLLQRGLKGNIARRVGLAGAVGAATEMPQEAVQTAMEMSFRPDLPLREKMSHIMDAALTGAAVGGVLGSAGGIRRMKTADPSHLTNDDITSSVDEKIDGRAPASPPPEAATEPQAPIQTVTDPETGQTTPVALEPAPATPVEGFTDVEAAPTPQPAPVAPTDNPLAGQDINFLDQSRELLERKIATGQFTEEDTTQLAAVQAEIARRDEVAGGEQLEAFGTEQAPAAVAPDARPGTKATADEVMLDQLGFTPEVRNTQAALLQRLGKKRSKTVESIQANDEIDAIVELENRLETKKNWTKDEEALAIEYGLINEKGGEINYAAEIPKLIQRIDAEQARARTGNQAALTRANKLTERLNKMQADQAVLEQVAQRKVDKFERSQPVDIPIENVSDGSNSGADIERRKTLAAFKNLTTGQQHAVLDAPEFQGGETRQDKLIEAIVSTSAAQQSALRNVIAQRGYADPRALGKAKPEALARDPSTMTEAQRMILPLAKVIDDRAGSYPDSVKRSALTAVNMVRQGNESAQEFIDRAVARAERFESGETVFSAGTPATGQSLERGRFDREFNRVLTQAGIPGSNIKVVDNFQALPDEVQEVAMDRAHPENGIKGVLHDGIVYVVRSNIRSEADLQETVLHEVLGHVGARTLFGARRSDAMSELFRAAGGIAGIRNIARKLGVSEQIEEYIPKGKLTEAERVRVFDELLAAAAGNPQGKVKTALLEWGAKVRAGLVSALNKMGFTQLANKLRAFGTGDVVRLLREMRYAALAGEARAAGEETAFRVDIRTPQGAEVAVKKVKELADNALNVFSRQSQFRAASRQFMLGFQSINHMVVDNKDNFPQLKQYADANQFRQNVSARWAHLFDNAYSRFLKLETTSPKMAKTLGKLMRYTEFSIDPRKTWADHTWLHDDTASAEVRGKQTNLKQMVTEANNDYYQLDRAGHAHIYESLLAVNEAINYAQMGQGLYNMVASDPHLSKAISGFAENPMDTYIAEEAVFSEPAKARDFWKDRVKSMTDNVSAYIDATSQQEATMSKRELEVHNVRISPLRARLQSIGTSVGTMDQAPYFHMGRKGNYFVAFTMKHSGTDKAPGAVLPGVQDRVAKTLEAAGFTDAQLSAGSDQAKVFIRVETQDQAENLRQLAEKMKADGLVAEDRRILSGDRRAVQDADAYQTDPQFVENYIQSIEASYSGEMLKGMSDYEKEVTIKARDAMVAHAREVALNALPDSALAKVLTHRDSRPGYSKDMMTSFAYRMRVGVGALAGVAAAQKSHKAFTDMRARINESIETEPVPETTRLQDVFAEVMLREQQRPVSLEPDYIDKWRAWNHAYFLGMSPSYVAVNTTQVGVLLWPELSKKHGFVASAKAIARVTPMAFKIIAATIRRAKDRGWKNVADAVITGPALKQAGLSDKDVSFVMGVVNTGNIDIGSFARELARVAEAKQGSKEDTILRFAAAAGYYSETLTRLIAALSARDLHVNAETKKNGKFDVNDPANKTALMDYVNSTINESMFQYSSTNTARQTGRMGLAGKFSQVMASFLTYSMQLTEKMYREMHEAFSGTTPQARKEARKFLGGHMAAIVTLSGTLGMPMATAFAAAAEKLVDLFDDDDQPYDIKAHYRNFLADTFGKEIGEVIARGLPRAIGIDISQRVGEQDMLPFSKILADKRSWEDASKDYLVGLMGSPVSMGMNIYGGMSEIARGNVIEGMIKMAPAAIRGPTQAYSMSQNGYTDKAGNKLPMTVGAGNILAQALGFSPAEKAEYSEERRTLLNRKSQLVRAASNIRKNLAEAYERGDVEDAQKWYAEGQKFDSNNPAYAVLPNIASTLRRRAQSRNFATTYGTVLGAKRKDVIGIEQARFGNR